MKLKTCCAAILAAVSMAVCISAEAAWRYTTDGGTTWTEKGTSVLSGYPFSSTLTTGDVGQNVVELMSDCTFGADLEVHANLTVRSYPDTEYVLTRTADDKQFNVKKAVTLTLEGFVLDGGAVWSSQNLTDVTSTGYSGTIGYMGVNGASMKLGRHLTVRNVRMTKNAAFAFKNIIKNCQCEIDGATITDCRGIYELFRAGHMNWDDTPEYVSTRTVLLKSGEITRCANMSTTGNSYDQRRGLIAASMGGVVRMTGGSIHDNAGTGAMICERGGNSDPATQVHLKGGDVVNNVVDDSVGEAASSSTCGGFFANADWSRTLVFVGGDFVCTNNVATGNVKTDMLLYLCGDSSPLKMDMPLLPRASLGVRLWLSKIYAAEECAAEIASAANIFNAENTAQVATQKGETLELAFAAGTDPQPTGLAGAVVTLDKTVFEYTGFPRYPDVLSVTLGDTALVAGTDYEFSVADNTAVGTGRVIVKGRGNYGGIVEVPFQIAKNDFREAVVTDVAATYTTASVDPVPRVYVDGVLLKEGRDYACVVTRDGAEGTVVISGRGTYHGEKTMTFEIVPATALSSVPATTLASGYYRTGATLPKVVPTLTAGDGTTLVEGVDFTVSYSRSDAGVVTCMLTAVANSVYSGSRTFTYQDLGAIPSGACWRFSSDGEQTWTLGTEPVAGTIEGGTLELLDDQTFAEDLVFKGTNIVRSAPGATFRLTRSGTKAIKPFDLATSVTFENVTLDGGAVWANPEVLTDASVTAGSEASLIIVKGVVRLGAGAVIENVLPHSRVAATQFDAVVSLPDAGTSDAAGEHSEFVLDGGIIRNCRGAAPVIAAKADYNWVRVLSGEITLCWNGLSQINGSGKCSYSGMIAMYGSSRLYMTGGRIHHNKAGIVGAVLLCGVAGSSQKCEFYFYGGEITDNEATKIDSAGAWKSAQSGGVFVNTWEDNCVRTYLHGTPVLQNNLKAVSGSDPVEDNFTASSGYPESCSFVDGSFGGTAYVCWDVQPYGIKPATVSVEGTWDSASVAHIANDADRTKVAQVDGTTLKWVTGSVPQPTALTADDVVITGLAEAYPSNPNGVFPRPQVALTDGTILKEGVDFDFAWSKVSKKQGLLTIVFKGSYSGCVEATYAIKSRGLAIIVR